MFVAARLLVGQGVEKVYRPVAVRRQQAVLKPKEKREVQPSVFNEEQEEESEKEPEPEPSEP